MNNFSESVIKALGEAVQEAKKRKNTEITEAHLLSALLREDGGYFQTILKELGIAVYPDLDKEFKRMPTFEGGGEARASATLTALLQEAEVICKKWNDTYISSDHILMAFRKKGFFKELSEKELEKTILRLRGDRHIDSPMAEQNVKVLDKFCKNYTKLAKEGNTEPGITPI